MRKELNYRTSEFKTRDDSDTLTIEGYFAVFNSNYQITEDMSESIAPGAFDNSISGDIRALVNHDTSLVLGRTSANTLELRQDSHGLWGKVTVNPNDTDAMNLYERVKRGDVSGCSIGFEVRKEDTEISEDGKIHWTLRDVELHEVSCCTFPAYESTNISARQQDREEIIKRENEAWREKMRRRLAHGTQTDASPEEDQ